MTRNVIQQVTIFATQTVTQQVGSATTTASVSGPYIVIKYYGKTVGSISFGKPAAGNIFLVVTIQIENHGSTVSHSFLKGGF